MPTIPQFPQQVPSADVPQKQRPLSLVLLTASAIFYIGILILCSLSGYRHLHLLLLVLQYGIILPLALWFLRSRQTSVSDHGLPHINIGIALVVFAVVAIPLSRFSAQGLLNPDESAYSFQARIYRSGRLMADPLIGATTNIHQTPLELYYENHVLLPRGWFAKLPPGWPLALSFGYLISAPWLLNPIFGLLQLIAIAAIAKRIFSVEAGVVAIMLAILSPFFLVNSIGLMSHALCALLCAGACTALFRALATSSLWSYAAMFACLAVAIQVRPYTGFVMAFVLTLAALWLNRDNRSLLLRNFAIGAFFGIIALACGLLYNHSYTGNWFVSPYATAAGANTPPELSFNPVRIWQGIRNYAAQTTEESLIGAFPFAYLLAAYTLLREKTRRKEVWILASVYIALVLAYLAHPEGSGVFFGERFHFEAFFALLLLAARGWQLLAETWHIPRRAQALAMLLFAAMQIAQQAATVNAVEHRVEPYRKVRQALTDSDVTGLVFLHNGPGFVAKHFNLNDADWRRASKIYLVDAESNHRDEWTCRYGFSMWTVVSYDARSKHASLADGKADCVGKKRSQ